MWYYPFWSKGLSCETINFMNGAKEWSQYDDITFMW